MVAVKLLEIETNMRAAKRQSVVKSINFVII